MWTTIIGIVVGVLMGVGIFSVDIIPYFGNRRLNRALLTGDAPRFRLVSTEGGVLVQVRRPRFVGRGSRWVNVDWCPASLAWRVGTQCLSEATAQAAIRRTLERYLAHEVPPTIREYGLESLPIVEAPSPPPNPLPVPAPGRTRSPSGVSVPPGMLDQEGLVARLAWIAEGDEPPASHETPINRVAAAGAQAIGGGDR